MALAAARELPIIAPTERRFPTDYRDPVRVLTDLAAAYPGAVVELEGMLWVQGERDARQGYQDAYEANLRAFIADVRATFATNLPFVVMRLSSGQTNLPAAGLAGAGAILGVDPAAAGRAADRQDPGQPTRDHRGGRGRGGELPGAVTSSRSPVRSG